MRLHDEYARRTPFEIAFPDRAVVERISAEVAAEARPRAADDSLLETFITTTAVGEQVRRLRGADAPLESGYPFAALLYHAVHFLRAGCPLYLLGTRVTRWLVGTEWARGGSAAGADAPVPPTAAGYLQLPQHLVWTDAAPVGEARAGEGAAHGAAGSAPARPAPESLDGLFWTVGGSAMLNVLPVAGLLPHRPGFGALPLPPVPLVDARIWLDATVRSSGDDFESTLPGGELDRLYSVRVAGEVLKLLARFFAVVGDGGGGAPRGVQLEARGPHTGPHRDVGGAPRSSGLPYTRVSLAG